MSISSFLRWLFPSRFSRHAAVTVLTLFALAWSQPALGGEIHDAAAAGNLEVVRALVKDKPLLVFSRDQYGRTPLHWAAEEGHKDVAELLLANQAKVDAIDNFGHTALHWAAASGRKDVAEMLLADKANVNARDYPHAKDYHVPQDLQMDPEKPAGLMQLATEAKVHTWGEGGETPLHWAVQKGHKDMAQLLLANQAKVNAKDLHGHTPLHWTAMLDSRDMAELLLAHQAMVNARDNVGGTPLHYAALNGYMDMAELLLAHQAKVNARDKVGDTPLHVAMAFGHQDLVDFLRHHGGRI